MATTRRRRASRPKANSTRKTLVSTQTLPVRLPTRQSEVPCQSSHAPWPKGMPSRRLGRRVGRGGRCSHENGTSVALVHTNVLSDVHFRTICWPLRFTRYTQTLAAIFIYLLLLTSRARLRSHHSDSDARPVLFQVTSTERYRDWQTPNSRCSIGVCESLTNINPINHKNRQKF